MLRLYSRYTDSRYPLFDCDQHPAGLRGRATEVAAMRWMDRFARRTCRSRSPGDAQNHCQPERTR